MIALTGVDREYFDWLYRQIDDADPRNPQRSHRYLARKLYLHTFRWFVPNDDNRIEDGKALWSEFLDHVGE